MCCVSLNNRVHVITFLTQNVLYSLIFFKRVYFVIFVSDFCVNTKFILFLYLHSVVYNIVDDIV